MPEIVDRPLFRLGKRKSAQPVWFLTLGFGSLYFALAIFELGGLVEMPTGGWWILPGMTVVCQVGLLAAFRFGLIGRSMDRLGLVQVLAVVFQLAVIAWWVPGGRPLLMVFWLLTLSHVASFFGWRVAGAISALLTLAIGFAMTQKPFDPSWEPFALGLFICAQAFAVLTHDWLYGMALRREIQSRTLTELMPVGIFRIAADGRFLSVNKHWRQLVGMTHEEALGDGWIRGVHHEDRGRVAELWRRASAAAEPFEAEFRFHRPDGRVIWLLGRAVPLLHRQGKVSEYLGTTTEITDRVVAEQEADKANRVKTEFLANMSHEIRTPISGIVGAAELMSRRELDAGTKTYVDVIGSSAASLLMLIDSLLDFSKIEAGKLTLDEVDFPVRETVGAAVHMLKARAASKGLELDSRVEADVPARLHGDSMRLHQILVNLISNAIKFTAEGRVRVGVRLGATSQIQVDDGHLLIFDVLDTGIGIDPAIQEELFSPFAQADSSTSRRYGGSGLGLSICKRITEVMGGEIRVESEPGRGSTFIVEVPFKESVPPEAAWGTAPEAAQETAPEAARDTAPEAVHEAPSPTARADDLFEKARGDFRILVVDDNGINRMIAVSLLEELGYRVSEAADGREALEALAAESFDLLLMDCQMPELDGYETTRRIRRDQADGHRLPIIAVTAHAVTGDRERCLEAGMDDYIAKPYASETLDRTVRRWLWVDERASSGDAGSAGSHV